VEGVDSGAVGRVLRAAEGHRPAPRYGSLACGTVNRVPEERLGSWPKCGRCGEKLADGQVRPLDGAIPGARCAKLNT
jgi:hypothetical protein